VRLDLDDEVTHVGHVLVLGGRVVRIGRRHELDGEVAGLVGLDVAARDLDLGALTLPPEPPRDPAPPRHLELDGHVAGGATEVVLDAAGELAAVAVLRRRPGRVERDLELGPFVLLDTH
jgi:hypothetical protein